MSEIYTGPEQRIDLTAAAAAINTEEPIQGAELVVIAQDTNIAALTAVSKNISTSPEGLTESFDLQDFVEGNYESVIQSLGRFGLISEGMQVPSKDTVLKALESLNPAQKEVIAQLEDPVLLLKPPVSSKALIHALDATKILSNQCNTFVGDVGNLLEKGDNNSQGDWEVIITEGASAPAPLKGESIIDPSEKRNADKAVKEEKNSNFKERLLWFEQQCKEKGMKGIDIKEYILLYMHLLSEKSETQFDDFSANPPAFTVLGVDEKNIAFGFFLKAYGRIQLQSRHVDDVVGFYGRFRPVVSGSVAK